MNARKSPRNEAAPAGTVEKKLLDGTLALLEAEGVAALSVRKIAGASGRSTMCVYSHFGGLGPLLTALYGQAAGHLLRAVDGDPDSAPSRYVEWAREHPHLYRFLFDADLAQLGIEAARRRDLMESCVAAFGGDEEGYRRQAMAHGLVTIERVTEADPAPSRDRGALDLVARLLARC